MNVKFRMPKFGQMSSGKGMLRELLMTTLGTTISIVLTFGTAAWLDQRQQAKNRRQTAMMVLSNIEDFAQNMRYVDSTLVECDSTLTRIAALPRDSVLRLSEEETNAFFKATVEANALETLYDAQQDKVAQATIGTLAEGQKTGAAVKTVKLLAQSTGEFSREELKKDVKFAWTDKAKADIAAAKGGTSPSPSGNGGGGSNSPVPTNDDEPNDGD